MTVRAGSDSLSLKHLWGPFSVDDGSGCDAANLNICFANETTTAASTTSIGTSISGTRVDPELIGEYRENVVMSTLIPTTNLNKGTLTAAWPTLSTTVTLSAISSGTAEADAVTATTLVTAAPSATAASKAAAVLQSWLSAFASEVNWEQQIPLILGRAAANLRETDAMSLTGAHNNYVGTSGVTCDLDILRQASVTLRVTALGAACCGAAFFLHDQQISDVDAELLLGTGAGLSTLVARQDVVDWYGSTPGCSMMNNLRGKLFSFPVFQSTLVPNANGTTDHGGALVIPALAYRGVEAWGPRIDVASQAANLKLANSQLVSLAYAYAEVKDTAGVSVITKHR